MFNRRTIAFDFDGVIHDYKEGWKNGEIYGNINLDLLRYMKRLLKSYNVVIFSVRNPQQIVDTLNELNIIQCESFEGSFWKSSKVVGVTNQKPVAILYVDDRAFEYIPDLSTDLNIRMLESRLKNI